MVKTSERRPAIALFTAQTTPPSVLPLLGLNEVANHRIQKRAKGKIEESIKMNMQAIRIGLFSLQGCKAIQADIHAAQFELEMMVTGDSSWNRIQQPLAGCQFFF